MLRVAEQYTGTDTGLQRRANEDSLLARAPLFVVADGMGGAQAGEVASRLAVESFHNGLGEANSPERQLEANAHAANARIHELSQSDARHAGMGTTLTAVYVGAEEVAIAHVGDSRAYCMRDGELMRLTDDHSLVDELIREGRLTPEEAEEHPQRSIITRALGPEETVEVDTRSFRARAGDVYLLCSDGLTSMVPEARVAEILRSERQLRRAGEALIAEANRAGGRDNITVILLRLEDVGVPGAPAGQLQREPAQRAGTALAEQPTGTLDQLAAPASGPASAPASAPAPGSAPASAPAGTAALALRRAETVVRRQPRRPAPAQAPVPLPRRRLRRALPLLIASGVLALVLAGGYLASQSVYFVATNDRGLVSIYQGVPYELPAGIRLYNPYYVSGVELSSLRSPARRSAVLDHRLRSEAKAAELIRAIELEQAQE